MTVQVAPPAPAPEPQQMAEPEPTPQEEPRRIEPPAPRVKYTGDNYYRTRQRLAYHPADKQFREAVAVKFDESPTVEQVETTTSSYQEQPKATRSSDRKSRAEQLAEYEKEYLERLSRQPEPEPERAEAPRPRGTMPAGWKPS
jgi:ABC-type oligopeptide transport system substrate-binding subunit